MKSRSSNIELLRILAACGVVILHYNNANIGGALNYVSGDKVKLVWLCFTESISICAVNLFFLISGYFMWKRTDADLFKPFKLLTRKSLLNAFSMLFYYLLFDTAYTSSDYIRGILPVDWFLITYTALFILSPYIHCLVTSLKEEDLFRLILISFFLFSVWPTVLDMSKFITGGALNSFYTISNQGSQYGYTMVNALLMYLIGAYLGIALSHRTYSNGKVVPVLLCNTMAITAWAFINYQSGRPDTVAWFYSSPLVILQAVLMFLFFRGMDIKSNAVINTLSGQALTVYMLHKLFFHWLYIERAAGAGLPFLIINQLSGAFCIYLVCWCIGSIYDVIMKPFYHVIDSVWKRWRIIKVNPERRG